MPWYFAIGNHDVLNNGGFVPGGKIGYFTADDYTGGWSRMGYIPGIGAVVEYLLDHPDQKIITWGGLYGFFVDWRTILWLLTLDENWEKDIDPRFDVERYVNGTPDDPGDDGVAVTPDPLRWFLGHAGVVPVVADAGHGFADHNDDGEIDAADGGWYRIDAPDKAVPIRYLVLDSMDAAVSSEGGYGRAQLNWLEDELDEAQEDGMLVVVASHHPTETVLIGAERFQDLLPRTPTSSFISSATATAIKPSPIPAWTPPPVIGKSKRRPSVPSRSSRAFSEIVDNRDGTGTIYSTLFDHYPIDGDDPDALAVKGRELGFESYLVLGYDGGGFHGYGGPGDRNLALKFQLTEDMADVLAAIPSGGPVTSTDVLGTLF
ncbi:MAG: hypothetical protein M5R36_12395 [Deltaproteobacteria bacterium]|nr:hypothetical protein [Deltaproteobacteria bacterium]